MAKISDEVLSGTHLREFRTERAILVPFLHNFDVTWARSYRSYNTRISAYFLKPDDAIQQQFGIDSEILLAICDFSQVQARTLQCIEEFIEREPARGRVDPTLFLLATPDRLAQDFMKLHASLNSQARVPVILNSDDLQADASDRWFVRRAIGTQLYTRDIFNEQLPLHNDLYFVGRDKLVADLLTSIKQNRNRGLFGLRKTGKTSVLFKVRRLAERDAISTLYYDCKDPEIRSMKWDQLLYRIMADLKSKGFGGKASHSLSGHVSGMFKRFFAKNIDQGRVCIIFDEIEYISPIAKLDLHWHQDFVPFWQTLWTTQSEVRNLSIIMAGVNPTIVEIDEVNGVQNPVFGIVSADYVTGLSLLEVKTLLNQIGRRMGMDFDSPSSTYIYTRYGGHPLLTRMACSYIHTFLQGRNQARPAKITEQLLKSTESEREEEISFYCRHVISELRQFYSSEYELLEMLASGNVAGFIENMTETDVSRHLIGYGLIDGSLRSTPTIKLPVLSRFINAERARRLKTPNRPFVISEEMRQTWLQTRVARITSDIRQMERVSGKRGLPRLYGDNGFPEAERFHSIAVVANLEQFQSFINICNRCFVEPVERFGNTQNNRQYFWKEIHDSYPDFWTSLLRVKLYRHHVMHLELIPAIQTRLEAMLESDFLGQVPQNLEVESFALQQFVLNGLFVGAQVELDKLI